MDIVAGPFWYEGPEFQITHELYPAKEFPKPPSPTDSLYSFVHDFNGDGWPDVLVVGRVHLHQAFCCVLFPAVVRRGSGGQRA